METYFLENHPGYRHLKNKEYIRQFPVACQGLLKKGFQCQSYFFKGDLTTLKGVEEFDSILEKCNEKLGVNACIQENLKSIRYEKYRRDNVVLNNPLEEE